MGIIESISPDILVIEEVWVIKKDGYIKQKDLVKELNALKFKHFQFSKSGINMICSKKGFDFDCTELNFSPDPVKKIPRCALIARFKTYTDLVVAGTHLDVFDESGDTRVRQIEFLTEYLGNNFDKSSKIIVTGDFNSLRKADYSTKEWDNIVRIDEKRNVKTIQDVVPVIEKNKFKESFSSLDKKLKVSVWSDRRVDYIYGKNIKFKSSECYRSTASDHFPIYADFSK
jgi:endonuclease/exonuclease/phosphatase family metal-dependent hydrolase